MTRSYGSKAMTQKQGRLQFQLLLAQCTDAALERMAVDTIVRSYAGVTRDMANKALLAERLRRSVRHG